MTQRRHPTPPVENIRVVDFAADFPLLVDAFRARLAFFTRDQPNRAEFVDAIEKMTRVIKRYFTAERIGPALGTALAQLLDGAPRSDNDDPIERAAVVLLIIGPRRSRDIFEGSGAAHFARGWRSAMEAVPPAVWTTWAGQEASPLPMALIPAAAPAARAPEASDDEVRVADGDVEGGGGTFLRNLGRAVDRRLDQRVPPMAHAVATSVAHATRRAAAADAHRALSEAAPGIAAAAACHAREALARAGPEVVGLCDTAAAQHAARHAVGIEARLSALIEARFGLLAQQLAAARAVPPVDPPHPARAAGGGHARAAAAAAADDDDDGAGLTDDDDDGDGAGGTADHLDRILAEGYRRAGAFSRHGSAPAAPALWDAEICLQGRQTLAAWAAQGVGVDPNATSTLLATWNAAVTSQLTGSHRNQAATAVLDAVAYLRDGSSTRCAFADRMATNLTFLAVAARHGPAVAGDVAGSLRTDAIPLDLRRRIQAARRVDGTGTGSMVLADRPPAPEEVDAAALRRDTEPGAPRCHGGRGPSHACPPGGRGGRGGRREDARGWRPHRPHQPQPQQQQPQQQQPQQQPQPQQQQQQQQQQQAGRGNGGRGRGQA
jgi:hypothetical protein